MEKSNSKRVEELLAFSLGMINGQDGRMLIEKYKDAIENVTPHDMLKLEDKQMQMGLTPATIKQDVEKVINVFSKSLENYQWNKPKEGTFLYYLILENEAFAFKLNAIKKILKSYKGKEESDFAQLKVKLLPLFMEFYSFDNHYIKKENILFPYLEGVWESYRPLKVMWSLHDHIRRTLKQLVAILEQAGSQWSEFNPILGKYYSLVFRMIQKENIIIFPVVSETVSDAVWEKMHLQSFDYPFPFIEAPLRPQGIDKKIKEHIEPSAYKGGNIVSETGSMSVQQALLMFNHLPVDLTFVDENNRVVFFNNSTERFFPRSPEIVGRLVQNCHPPESVHMVVKIVEAFRVGERDKASFWINMKGRFILIQYFAVRDSNGAYKGVLEVSQDVTDIRSLTGERRLLDWK